MGATEWIAGLKVLYLMSLRLFLPAAFIGIILRRRILMAFLEPNVKEVPRRRMRDGVGRVGSDASTALRSKLTG